MSPATRDTFLVKVNLAGAWVKEALFLPAWINEGGQPEILDEKHAKNQEILGLLRSLSAARKTRLSIKSGIGAVQV